MIEKINTMCKEMKSNFSTEDGLTLVAYIGNLTFLKRTFNTIEECFNYVESAYNNTLVSRGLAARL